MTCETPGRAEYHVLLLSGHDLQPLIDDRSQLEAAFRSIEQAVVQMHRGEGVHVGWVDVPLGSQEVLGVFLTSSPNGASVRLWDSAVRHQLHAGAHLMLLLDPNDGRPKALLSSAALNPLRTSVPAGVGVKHLASPEARVLCILGSGGQAQSLARTCAHALPHLERIQIWNRTVARGERFATETSRRLGVPVELKDSPELAVVTGDAARGAGLWPDSRQLPGRRGRG